MLRGMFSAEPLTMPHGGSPQLFQSGETYRGRPIVDAHAVAAINLEEGAGVIPVLIEWRRDAPAHIRMSLPLPVFGSRFTNVGVMAEMLSIEKRAILETGLPMEVVSCGVPFLFVPVRRILDLRNIRFRRDVWERTLYDFEAPHIFVFARETEFAGSTVHSRMFAPALGIREDHATGGANGPLGCYLARHRVLPLDANGMAEFISKQGIEMGRPNLIKTRIEQKGWVISAVNISGQCHLMGEGFLYVY
jgi:trans-2,3-dihydro-3-hydroxyanthranilate isomerase